MTKNKIGNKAYNLERINEAGLNVPPFITLSNDFFNSESCNEKLVEMSKKLDEIVPSKSGWAVRSSSILEDGDNVSNAGKYKTLIIKQEQELLGAVLQVLSSTEKKDEMAVIIQRYVEGDYSGVVFSCNPILYTDDVFIELAVGAGDKVVNGLVNPYTFENGKWITDSPKIDPEVIQEIISTISDIKGLFGKHIDMEFCIKNNKVYWLQCRPVTTFIRNYKYEDIGRISNILKGDWFLLDQCTEPVTPLIQDLDPSGLFNSKIWNTIFFDNYPYIQMKKNVFMEPINKNVDVKKEWEVLANRFNPSFEDFLSSNLEGLMNDTLMKKLKEVVETYRSYTHLYMDRSWMLVRRETSSKLSELIKKACGEQVNLENELALLTSSLNTLTSQKIKLLSQIINEVNKSQKPIQEWIKESTVYKQFIEKFGFEMPYPVSIHLHSLSEKPEEFINRVKKLKVKDMTKNNQSDWRHYANVIKNKLTDEDKVTFEKLLLLYRDCLRRTENDDYLLQKGAASTRRILLYLSNNLHNSGIIEEKEDIFFLTFEELESIIDIPLNREIKNVIRKRKELFLKSRSRLPVSSLKTPNNYIMKKPPENSFNGNGVSVGVAEGRVYKIENSINRDEYENIPSDSIIVTSVLTPHLSYNLISVAGIVTEIGGFLSHGAIFAREVGIPALVGVEGALKNFNNGDKIRIDANAGTVIKL